MDISPRHEIGAVTISATNYLGKALALRKSYLAFHPTSDFYILLVAKKSNISPSLPTGVQVLWVEDLGIDNFSHYAMKFDVIELSTAIKASVLSALLPYYRKVMYIDPDICFYRDLGPVLIDLESCSVVVTPHTLSPIMDGRTPSDLDFLRMGAFNLGFIGVSKCDEGFEFLDWWSRRCLEYGSGVYPGFFTRMGLRDTFSAAVGSQSYLRRVYSLNSEAIAQAVTKNLAVGTRVP